MLDLVIFSKDRACQLDLLLRSYKTFFRDQDAVRLQVIYTYEGEDFGRAYQVVRELHPEPRWVCELDSAVGFRQLALDAVGHSPYVMFLVDDDVFKEPFTLSSPEFERFAQDPQIAALSLRMCPRMNYAYTLARLTPIPELEPGNVWDWTRADGDWAYPMSVDGNVFRSDELVPLMAELDFRNPNTLEAALARNPLRNPKMVCFDESRVINLPLNRVQEVVRNRHGQVTAEWLNEQFLAGRRLSLATVAGVRNPSPHHELDLRWEDDPPAEAPPAGPRVSVVIPCFNYGRHLEETVESVLAQTFAELEVVIVDDGSTDDTAAVAEALIARHPEAEIALIRQERSGHPAHARNAGIAASRGEYVLCLDADDRLHDRRFIGALVNALDVTPEAGVAYSDLDEFGARERRHVYPEYDLRRLSRRNEIGICSLFRREAWEAVGGFEERGYEDWSFWLALGERGFTGVKVPGVTWGYRVHDEGRHAADLASDAEIKARLVLDRPSLYTEAQREWAERLLAGDPVALAVPHAPGEIPEVSSLPPAGAAGADDDGVRSFTTVVLADEAVSAPDLIGAYASAFGPNDDATLVIYAPDADPEAVGERLMPVLSSLGLDGPGAPDMMALAVPGVEGDSAISARADAFLTRGPAPAALAGLRRFEPGSIAQLRAHAEAAWGLAAPAAADGAPAVAPEPGMRGFYAQFIRPGDLVFDVGANVGDRTEAFLALGATKVVAVEPQERCAESLRERFGASCAVTVVDKALGPEEGRREIYVCETSTITSMSPEWIEKVRASGRFAEFEWAPPTLVEVTTLDRLIEAHGVPAFCKIDVEGFEEEVLAGLSRPLPALSIEFTKETLDKTCACVRRLAELGMSELNYSVGESMEWGSPTWLDADTLIERLSALPDAELPWGDVYARTPQRDGLPAIASAPAAAVAPAPAESDPIPAAAAELARRKPKQRERFEKLARRAGELWLGAPDRPAFSTAAWRDFVQSLAADVLPTPPFDFLNHGVIRRTMFVDYGGAQLELQLRRLEEHYGELRMRELVEEDPVGAPLLQAPAHLTSHNAVMHLYHLARYERTSGVDWSRIERVVEWGGGYGSMARLLHRVCGHDLTYVVVDLPLFSVLQWLYLGSVLGEDRVTFLTVTSPEVREGRVSIAPVGLVDAVDLRADLFVSTWALSECERAAQDYVAERRRWFGAERLLLGYQQAGPLFPDAERVGELARAEGAAIEDLDEVLEGQRYAFR
ncbi:MAG: FkbM family methyltransferase [Thermoleophilaceae bacterium]|nr:FkbM family methyltransferase [Thermoleophilaceae bacterium]